MRCATPVSQGCSRAVPDSRYEWACSTKASRIRSFALKVGGEGYAAELVAQLVGFANATVSGDADRERLTRCASSRSCPTSVKPTNTRPHLGDFSSTPKTETPFGPSPA